MFKKIIEIWEAIEKWTICLGIILIVITCWAFRYSFTASDALHFPSDSTFLHLKKQQELVVIRGVFNEEYVVRLREGYYQKVLENEAGAFFLSPPLGFFTNAYPVDGYAVGGIYVPSNLSEPAYIWEYPLTNKNRSFSSPSPSRTLSMTADQPERELLLDSSWYGSKGFSLLGYPLVDTDFELERTHFSLTESKSKSGEGEH